MTRKANLRKFRSDVALLKRKGLVSPDIDARSAKPTKALRRALDKYDAVLSGKASAVKLDRSGIAAYKKLGKPYDIAAPRGLPRRVIIPHEAGEKVTVSHGKVTLKQAGVTRTIVPVKYHDLEQYLNDLGNSKIGLDKDEYLAFRFFGNRSHRVFRSISALANTLQHYESIFNSIDDNNAEQMAELYQNLEIIKIVRPDEWKNAPRRRDTYRQELARRRKSKRKSMDELPEFKRQAAREANAARQREYRARLKHTDPAKWERYKALGRKRAAKSKKSK